MRQTSRLRVGLAVLVGAFGSVLIPYGLLSVVVWLYEAMTHAQTNWGFWVMGLVITLIAGVPIALLAITLLFGPIWILIHRRGAALLPFLASAAFVQTLTWAGVLLLDSSAKPIPIWSYPILLGFGALTGLVIWLVAYGGTPTVRQPHRPRPAPAKG